MHKGEVDCQNSIFWLAMKTILELCATYSRLLAK